jgi:hypothetical protein
MHPGDEGFDNWPWLKWQLNIVDINIETVLKYNKPPNGEKNLEK